MEKISTSLSDVYILKPRIFEDKRGYFFESCNEQVILNMGINVHFVQDNQAYSTYGVLRGLHYQKGEYAQAKLVRVLQGIIWDVVADIRPNSPTYKKWFGVELSAENKLQLFVPRGFAHGYIVLSETAEIFYKCDNYYAPAHESGIIYNDKNFNIDWKLTEKDFIISPKDLDLPSFL